ncbi:MAG: M15 family metallopeptidase [Tannerella sp.]|jgi:D-alanyl-D-alanine dipeptidase|nr:M15 family metallopeptidase [Tannerella sp.]
MAYDNFISKRSILLLLLVCFSVCSHAEDWDKRLQRMGFVDIQKLDATIRVHLVYATPSNFMKKAVYQGLTKAWLHPDAAKKLVKAQKILQQKHPDYALLVYDAARPIAIQHLMWNLVRGTPEAYYVANPVNKGGRHNYGMAVDVTVTDAAGKPLPMGTPFDFFGEEANTDKEDALLKAGKITPVEYQNRQLLRRVMRQAGFTTVTSEWWHFNACSSNTAQARYKLIE